MAYNKVIKITSLLKISYYSSEMRRFIGADIAYFSISDC
ncbi:hypothetical protein PRUB_a1930 [Pseudoalteromonas rubra]|uniref:Uncharacterized protein n=1 Tax=Pseudoalteromonas rubra TaxID=43658 RepID=A0A8T0CDQ8_9GAMM|nr:hypothetical protein PRUB_a1930 [Pseudoalteromonas rubra]